MSDEEQQGDARATHEYDQNRAALVDMVKKLDTEDWETFFDELTCAAMGTKRCKWMWRNKYFLQTVAQFAIFGMMAIDEPIRPQEQDEDHD